MTENINKLINIIQDLRNPKTGCPWDIKQDFESIIPHTIEEAYEVQDAIIRKDNNELKDELGDLLLQVVFISQIAKEKGYFNFNDVVNSICDKMVRRHPHIFDNKQDLTPEQIASNWEKIKQQEKQDKNTKKSKHINTNDIPLNAPSLSRANRISKKAVSYGFEWDNINGVYDKINEEIEEVKSATNQQDRTSEIGDVLFSVVNLARHYDIDPEFALSLTNQKFTNRFNNMMNNLNKDYPNKINFDIDTMEKYWQISKQQD